MLTDFLLCRRKAVLAAAAVVVALGAQARDPEISHDKVVAPKPSLATDPALDAIGLPMSFAVQGDRLVIGASRGIAVLDATGKLVWALELPLAVARQVGADANGVAFTSFDVVNVDRSSTLANPLLGGDLGARYEFANAVVGLADAQGKLLWTVPSVEQGKLAPPALTGTSVGVVGIKTFAVYERAGGKPTGTPADLAVNTLGLMDGLFSQFPSRAAVVAGDVFHLVRNNFYKRVDATGKELESSRGVGLFKPFEYVPAGPALLGDLVVFANSPSKTDERPLLVAAKVGGGMDWNERLDAMVKTGFLSYATDAPMDLIAAAGSVFVTTNFSTFRYSASGSQQWRARNDKGGLFPSALRGSRYIGNMFERKVPIPKTFVATPLLAATAERVYVATAYVPPEGVVGPGIAASGPTLGSEDGKGKRDRVDTITVLDAKSGEYVETWWQPGWRILGLAVFGESLAVLTGDGLRFVALR